MIYLLQLALSADFCDLRDLASNLGMEEAQPSIYSELQDVSCCSAQGVTCNLLSTTVNSVIWSGLGLTGKLQSQYLPGSLTKLDLSKNKIAQMGSLTFPSGLKNLNLNSNLITALGGFPSALIHLDIGNNPLANPPPIVPASVTYLDFSNISLAGISSSIVAGRVYVDLSGNKITGLIPTLPGSLTYLDLNSNKFTGSIPTLPSGLKYLDLSLNTIRSVLPTTLPAGLTYLNLNGNTLAQRIPTLPSGLTFLGLNGDESSLGLSGTIPALPSGLLTLQLSFNSLTGSLPLFPTGLKVLDLAVNLLSGPLPSQFPPGLTFLDVQYNKLSGIIPVLPIRLQVGFFSGNLFTGNIPTPLPNTLTNLALDENKMSGDVPTLPLSLQYLWLGYPGYPGNQFNGSVRMYKPINLVINDNYITDVRVTDKTALTSCDLSNNPLLGNLNIAALTMCLKNGLYSAALPVTISLSKTTLKTSIATIRSTTTFLKTNFTTASMQSQSAATLKYISQNSSPIATQNTPLSIPISTVALNLNDPTSVEAISSEVEYTEEVVIPDVLLPIIKSFF